MMKLVHLKPKIKPKESIMLNEKSLILPKNGLYPNNYYDWSLIHQPDSLSVIAETDPQVFNKVTRKVLFNQRVSERNETIRKLSSHNRDIICTWLQNRWSDEKRFKARSYSDTKANTFFGQGEMAGVTTVVEIG
ncbi:MAG: hypothetical protein ACKKL5_03195 [Candidatus Komeilibacteria bacterium]